ncbi:MAG TPA: GNAT family N-acetyltransferase [Candidatus Limnocylindrales bacterium]
MRRARAADLDAVTATFLACWHESYANLLPPDVRGLYTLDTAREMWRRTPLESMLVAEMDGVLGVTRFGADPDEPTAGHIFSLYVHPAGQGLGLGRALLDAATARLREAGYAEATLWVFAGNDAARRFYTKQGWLPDGGARVEEAYRLPEVRLRQPLS